MRGRYAAFTEKSLGLHRECAGAWELMAKSRRIEVLDQMLNAPAAGQGRARYGARNAVILPHKAVAAACDLGPAERLPKEGERQVSHNAT